MQALTLELEFLQSHPPTPATTVDGQLCGSDANGAGAGADELRGRVEALEAERQSLLADRRLLKAHAKELGQQVGRSVIWW